MSHERLESRAQLRAGGDNGLIAQFIDSAAIIAGLVGTGAVAGVRLVDQKLSVGAAVASIVGSLAIAAAFIASLEPDQRKRCRDRLGVVLRHLSAGLTMLDSTSTAVSAVIPRVPTSVELRNAVSDEKVLLRQMIRTMARVHEADYSAAGLAGLLSSLEVPHSHPRVRALLRSNKGFTLVARGRWQLGKVTKPLLRTAVSLQSERKIGASAD